MLADNANIAIVTAAIAAATSVVVALMGVAERKRSAQRTEEATSKADAYRNELSARLAELQFRLSDEGAERQARRDYEYEGRKHLYQACGPLLFQLTERSEDALYRIYGLAREARAGHLGSDNWLSDDGYFALSTMHRFLAPCAIFRLIQDRLTSVDLALEESITATYNIARFIGWSFTDDFWFAAAMPSVDYEPNVRDWSVLRADDPARYWRQGIPAGRLEQAVDAIVVRESDERSRCMRSGEFEAAYRSDSEFRQSVAPMADILRDFHPASRPVLWRILVTQAHLYVALSRERDPRETLPVPTASTATRRVTSLSSGIRQSLDWRRSKEEGDNGAILVAPFQVAEEYLKPRLGALFLESAS